MKQTKYFTYVKKRPDRAIIREAWIVEAINNPVKTIIQNDGRVRKWLYIPEENKYLRVILLDDEETVHNAFFDRNYKEEANED